MFFLQTAARGGEKLLSDRNRSIGCDRSSGVLGTSSVWSMLLIIRLCVILCHPHTLTRYLEDSP